MTCQRKQLDERDMTCLERLRLGVLGAGNNQPEARSASVSLQMEDQTWLL